METIKLISNMIYEVIKAMNLEIPLVVLGLLIIAYVVRWLVINTGVWLVRRFPE